MGIAFEVNSGVRLVTVRDWKTFYELSVLAGHCVTPGYLETKVAIN
jgi:hypothetical protein